MITEKAEVDIVKAFKDGFTILRKTETMMDSGIALVPLKDGRKGVASYGHSINGITFSREATVVNIVKEEEEKD